jgi:hypothetical protein
LCKTKQTLSKRKKNSLSILKQSEEAKYGKEKPDAKNAPAGLEPAWANAYT